MAELQSPRNGLPAWRRLALAVATRGAILLLLVPTNLGAQATVAVNVRGVDGDFRDNVLATLSLARAARDTALDSDRVRRLHDRARGEVARALEPFGFYHSRVVGELVQDGQTWTASYDIDPGRRTRVTSVRVDLLGEGAADSSFQAVRRAFPVVAGDALDHRRYDEGRRGFSGLAAARGYLDGRFETSELRVDREADTAAVVLRFVTGPRFRFGAVVFEQNVLDDEVLRRFVTFEEGDFYETASLLSLQGRLAATPYFAAVEVAPRRDLAEGLLVPIHITPVPRRNQRYAIGAGYGTNTGARGSLEAEFRRLNRKGHRADARLTASPLEQSVTSNYLIPGVLSGTRLLGFSASVANLDTETSQSRLLRLAASLSDVRGSWQEALSLNFQREAFEVGADTSSARLLTVSGGWARTVANDPVFPTTGSRLRFRVEGSHEAILSDVSFIRASVDASAISELADGVRLLARMEVGSVLTPDFRALPPTARFFSGGDESVRGFRYQTLGPPDEMGNVIGGNSLAVASVEIERRLFGRWALAAFVDVGNALDDFTGSLESGAGVGLRWRSPVGTVRLDGAFPISRADKPLVFHLRIGPDL